MDVEFIRPSAIPKRAAHSISMRSHSPVLLNSQPASHGVMPLIAAKSIDPSHTPSRPILQRPQSLPTVMHRSFPPSSALSVQAVNTNRMAAFPMPVAVAPPPACVSGARRVVGCSTYPLPPMPADFNSLPQSHSALCSSSHFQHGFFDCLSCLELRQKKVAALSHNYQQMQMDQVQQQHLIQAQHFHNVQAAAMSPGGFIYPHTPVFMMPATIPPSPAQPPIPSGASFYSQLSPFPTAALSVFPSLEELHSPMPCTPQTTCQLPEAPATRRQPQFFRWDESQQRQMQSRRSTPTQERKIERNDECEQVTHAKETVMPRESVTSAAVSSAPVPGRQRFSPIPKLDSNKLQQLLASFSDPSKVASLDPNECLSELMLIGDEHMNRMIGEQFQLTALTQRLQKDMEGSMTNHKERKAPVPAKGLNEQKGEKSRTDDEFQLSEETDDEHSNQKTASAGHSVLIGMELAKSEKSSKAVHTDKDGSFLSRRQKFQHKRHRGNARSSSSSPTSTHSTLERKRRRVDSPASLSSSLSCDSPSLSPASSAHTTPTLSPTHSTNQAPGELSFLAQIASLMR